MTQDVFPSLTQEFQSRVQSGLRKHFKEAAPEIDAESWQKLKPILAAYKRKAEFLRGFVNKGQVTKLRRISERTQKLLAALQEADEAGLTLIVEHALRGNPLNDDFFALDDLRSGLEALVQNLTTKPRDEPFLVDTSREYLVEFFVYWWRRSTGEEPKIEEGIEGFPPPTPFMYVANEVFCLPGVPQPTGASYKSLKDRLRDIEDRKKKIDRIGRRFSELFGSQSDDP
ncbi:MAG: hypothetical protein VR71_12260 [Roseovarius sp. BRH_c41]|uniref:hypothetical protein n=1 Tax=Roseovarius sp. BRH_c41 TaxID=1629709 RepID=UPI0005F0D247|nr:hypothetical protein [Roseovarius sp. BRH_c41]KJS42965.1 MAG: hypothetical protein VR71_12260 [Roseovarius sp. BRH_c41]